MTPDASTVPTPPDIADALREARAGTLSLVVDLDPDSMQRPLGPLMGPLVWDLGHIAAYEDLWCVHRHGGEPLLRADLAEVYDAFETPRTVRGGARLLDVEEALRFLDAVRSRTLRVLAERGASHLHEMVLRHELQHTETMRQALFLGGFPGGVAPRLPTFPPVPELVEVPAGSFPMGARPDGFAYDNERPRHPVDVPAFRISRAPITEATYLSFVEGGGYERREWWSDEGWAWKEQYDITGPLAWAGGGDTPVQHLSWFEAAAFARSLGARLPTEAEWEKAATWNHGKLLEGLGVLWEWTATEFDGYPGFLPHPYPQYSEVFFRKGHRVLRGGSWATPRRVATPTFRNWDHPDRRQLFCGLRVVVD